MSKYHLEMLHDDIKSYHDEIPEDEDILSPICECTGLTPSAVLSYGEAESYSDIGNYPMGRAFRGRCRKNSAKRKTK